MGCDHERERPRAGRWDLKGPGPFRFAGRLRRADRRPGRQGGRFAAHDWPPGAGLLVGWPGSAARTVPRHGPLRRMGGDHERERPRADRSDLKGSGPFRFAGRLRLRRADRRPGRQVASVRAACALRSARLDPRGPACFWASQGPLRGPCPGTDHSAAWDATTSDSDLAPTAHNRPLLTARDGYGLASVVS